MALVQLPVLLRGGRDVLANRVKHVGRLWLEHLQAHLADGVHKRLDVVGYLLWKVLPCRCMAAGCEKDGGIGGVGQHVIAQCHVIAKPMGGAEHRET